MFKSMDKVMQDKLRSVLYLLVTVLFVSAMLTGFMISYSDFLAELVVTFDVGNKVVNKVLVLAYVASYFCLGLVTMCNADEFLEMLYNKSKNKVNWFNCILVAVAYLFLMFASLSRFKYLIMGSLELESLRDNDHRNLVILMYLVTLGVIAIVVQKRFRQAAEAIAIMVSEKNTQEEEILEKIETALEHIVNEYVEVDKHKGYKRYKIDDMISELTSLRGREGNVYIAVNTQCESGNWQMAREFVSVGTDGEGTVYIDGKY